jgi:nifR3 family TIM-barrel protein
MDSWTDSRATFAASLLGTPFLAPMEDVTDPVFRAICRARGASLCVTEFVHAEHLRDGDATSTRKLDLSRDEGPTAIQIYGADPDALEHAARLADAANPAFVDINCGCWVPRVVHRGAGAAWLRDPDAMIAMAARVVRACSRPVTVKTRIGWGPESDMPVVDLARRLEDAGVAAITVHCRTAQMGHEGKADWRWAARAQSVVQIPVIVNGDITGAGLARKALAETGCAGVMIGRRAIEHPWIFRETRALLATGIAVRAPSVAERFDACREHVTRAVDHYGERTGVHRARRFFRGYLRGLPGGLGSWRDEIDTLEAACTRSATLDAIDAFEMLATKPREAQSTALAESSP